MKEDARKARNAQRMIELFPTYAARLKRVIKRLEDAGLRPRIQDAWRSPEDQLKAYNSGNSKLKYGYHNVTGANGRKEALAVDLLDDDFPTNSRKSYLLQLAAAAAAEGLNTGIRWGVPDNLIGAIDQAIAAKNWKANVHIGWDPTHTETTGVTVDQAENGKRPA